MEAARGVDGRSELPDDIIRQILFNLLPPDEVAKTRLLSKAWLKEWYKSPVLCFREASFFSCPGFCRVKFLNFINKVLLNCRDHNHEISTFKLEMNFHGDSDQLVDEWIKISLDKGLKKLDLRNLWVSYTLPCTILKAKSIEELDLYMCNFEQEQVTKSVMCSNLRRLVLDHVSLSDEVFEKIISNCTLIEILKIHGCKSLSAITVKNLAKLKEFSVCYGRKQNVRVEAPNLKLLVLCGVGITDMFFDNFMIKLPYIEELKIKDCNHIRRIKISSQSIRKIQLIDNEKLEELQVDAPNVIVLEYTGSSIPHVIFTPLSSPWEFRIGLNCHNAIGNPWLFKLKEMLTSLRHSKIFLGITCYASAKVDLNEIKDGPTDPRLEIEELSIKFSQWQGRKVSAAFLDGWMWCFRPRIIQQEWCFLGTIHFTQFLLEFLMISRNQGHLNLQEPKRLWLKDLKDVKVAILKNSILDDEWQPMLLDWKTLLHSRYSGDFHTAIRFDLEWR